MYIRYILGIKDSYDDGKLRSLMKENLEDAIMEYNTGKYDYMLRIIYSEGGTYITSHWNGTKFE